MSDAILGERFVSAREPAWHRKGTVFPKPIPAIEALLKTGEYKVELRPVSVTLNGEEMKTGYSHIVREPIPEDQTERVFGAPVSDDYELITPRDICEIFDRNVVELDGVTPRGVETFGVLNQGSEIFLSTKVSNIRAGNENVEGYLVVYSPMFSNKRAQLIVTFVRVVCQNTLRVAISKAIDTMLIPHHPGAKGRVNDWLGKMYGQYHLVAEQASAAFLAMMKIKVTIPQAKELVKDVILAPTNPEAKNGVKPIGDAFEEYMQRLVQINQKRATIVELFSGLSPTLRTPETEGTFWGYYNAVAEAADCMPTRNNASATNVLWGDRGQMILNAYSQFEALK